MAAVWLKIKAAGAWLWSHPAAIAAFVGSLLGAYFMWKSDKNKIASFQDALTVQKAKTDIARKTAQAEDLEAKAGAIDPKVAELKAQIADSKRAVVTITDGPKTKDMSDEEVADLFGRSGL
jgi:hypothetical protein